MGILVMNLHHSPFGRSGAIFLLGFKPLLSCFEHYTKKRPCILGEDARALAMV